MGDFLYRYRVLDCHIVDADTVDLTLDVGFRWSFRDRFRLYGPDPAGSLGLNAPELSTPEGRAARDWLVARLAGADLIVYTVRDRREKYGRLLAVLHANRADSGWRNVNFEMLVAGHAATRTY